MKKICLSLFLVLIAAISAADVQAFDGERKGFMLNLGAGFGQGKMSVSDNATSVSFDATGFGTDFKIGGGISPRTMLYYTNRALWYSVDVPLFDETISASMTNGMSAIGANFFLEPQAPSVFFSAAIGVGVLIDQDASESESGVGFTVGVGYEFSSNWTFEATYMKANVAEIDGVDLGISNLLMTINWLAY